MVTKSGKMCMSSERELIYETPLNHHQALVFAHKWYVREKSGRKIESCVLLPAIRAKYSGIISEHRDPLSDI